MDLHGQDLGDAEGLLLVHACQQFPVVALDLRGNDRLSEAVAEELVASLPKTSLQEASTGARSWRSRTQDCLPVESAAEGTESGQFT